MGNTQTLLAETNVSNVELAEKILQSAKNIANLMETGRLCGKVFVRKINVRNDYIPEMKFAICIKDEGFDTATMAMVIDSETGLLLGKSDGKIKYNYRVVKKEELASKDIIDLEYIWEQVKDAEIQLMCHNI